MEQTEARHCVHDECCAVLVYRVGLIGRPPTRCSEHGGTAERVVGEVSAKDVEADARLHDYDPVAYPRKTLADYQSEVLR